MFLKKDKYFLPLVVSPFFVCGDFFCTLMSLFPHPVCYVHISLSFLHLPLIPAFLFLAFFVPKVSKLLISRMGCMVHGNTDIGYFYSTSILGAKSYLVCFLIRGVKMLSSINCQLTDAVCPHDKVPNWPSIVFCSFFWV